MIGRTLSHYRITELIGRGGMGEVYRARDGRLERDVAVKLVRATGATDTDLQARFAREAKALATLSHPNTVAIFDYGIEDGVAYAVMELLEGHPLTAEMAEGALAPERAATVARAIAEGLQAAHAKGIVHRDLKPHNVFLTADGRTKLLDFGLAKRAMTDSSSNDDDVTQLATVAGTVLGTVAYMAPEMIDAGEAGPAADIFALGVVLHEMLAGLHPFRRDTTASTMAAILRDEPPPLPDAPAALAELARECLAKEPERRPVSAAICAARLREHLTPSGSAATVVPGPAIDSLAVLPFHNEAGDEGAEYLIDGLLDSLIDSLSRLPKLRIMARSTVQLRAHMHDRPLEVGRELGVRAVLVGRLQRRGDEIIVRTELVDATDGTRLWGERLRRPFGDLLEIEDAICREIAGQLRLTLGPDAEGLLARRHTVVPEAREAYLQGRFVWNRWKSPEAMRTAIAFFEHALELDPRYALAYGGLADSYSILGNVKAIPPGEAYPRAREAALQGLAIDPDAAELHAALAFVQRFWDWSWDAAKRSFRRALALNPGYATAYRFYGQLLAGLGEHDEAIAASQRALELDPLSPILHTALGDTLFYARRYDEAEALYRRCLEIDPGFIPGHTDLARLLETTGRHEEALAAYRMGETLAARVVAEPSSGMAHVLARMGRGDEALDIVAQLLERARTRYVSPYAIASIHACLGDRAAALDWLERAYREHDQTLVWIKVHPRLDSLRSEPRFLAILGAMNLATPV